MSSRSFSRKIVDFSSNSLIQNGCSRRHVQKITLIHQPKVVARAIGRRPSALRVDVKPRAPDSNETVLFKESFSYRVIRKIRPVGEAEAVEDHIERILFFREHVLDAEPELTRRSVGLGFNVLRMRLVKASRTVAFDMKGEAFSNVCRFSHIECWINELFRPPVSVFNVDRALAWPFENDVSVSSDEIGSRADPPEGVNAGALR
jgi:hypothetical protein